MKTKIILALIIVLMGFCVPNVIKAQRVYLDPLNFSRGSDDISFKFVSDTVGTNLPFSESFNVIDLRFEKVIYGTYKTERQKTHIVLLVIPKTISDDEYETNFPSGYNFYFRIRGKLYSIYPEGKLIIISTKGKSIRLNKWGSTILIR